MLHSLFLSAAPSLVCMGQMNKILSIFQRALNREIFETAECLEREVPLNTVEDVNTVRIAFK